MPITVGIPQALHFHEFGALWQDFFAGLNVPVVLSGETTKTTLDRGTSLAVDESCLPLKLYLGHVDTLLDNCDKLFVPRIARYHPDFYCCPKFAGLPDIVRNAFSLPADRLIVPNIDTASKAGLWPQLKLVANVSGASSLSGWRSFRSAHAAWQLKQAKLCDPPDKTGVAVIGHSYMLGDRFLSPMIFGALTANGYTAVTADELPDRLLYNEARSFAPVYWQLSAKLAGAVRYFSRQKGIAGLVLVASFGCGHDAMLSEYLQYYLQNAGKPSLLLNLDEHTGPAGICTRVEAFLDMLTWRQKQCE